MSGLLRPARLAGAFLLAKSHAQATAAGASTGVAAMNMNLPRQTW
jgi:hypothetical protein